MKFACQTYAWQMSGRFVGRLDHIIRSIGSTGFIAVEPETQFLGELNDPEKLAAHLKEANLEMAALTLVEDWLEPQETDEERRRADECQALLAHFPNTLLNLCQMPTTRPADASELRQRQNNLLSCANVIARRMQDAGLTVGYHPNSPETSIYRTADDYSVLLDGLDSDVLGWIPDVGHMAKVDIDPLKYVKDYRSLVNHVHYKDMDASKEWVAMGEGVIDFHALTAFLADTDFKGWIVVEDESPKAIPDPDGVTRDDWDWIKRELIDGSGS